MRRLFILAALGLVVYSGNAQDTRNRGNEGTPQQAASRQISGRVVDETGAPLAGATVAVYTAGSLTPIKGTYTDADGNYNLTLTASGSLTVKISFVGLKDQIISVADGSSSAGVTTSMISTSSTLDEIVVTGYGGTIERRDLTGSVARVSSAALENVPMTSIESMIQGRAAGVQITQGSGKLGQGITVRVRGAASVTAGNQPLYVVDGIPIVTEDVDRGAQGEPQSPIADLSPNDIESMEILKDASATAIYGSRGSNGVVLITTKKGRAGKTKVNLNYYFGVQQPTKLRKFLNTQQYFELLSDYGLAPEDVYGPSAFLFNTDQPLADTDWQREAYNFSAPVQQGDINISGGNERTTFYISGGYFQQAGTFRGNTFNRASSVMNLDHKLNDKIKVGIQTKVYRTLSNRPENDNLFNSLTQSVALVPMFSPRNPFTGEYNNRIPYRNPFIFTENSRTVSQTLRTISSIYGEFELLKGLVYHADLGVDLLDNKYDQWVGSRASSNFSSYQNGYAVSQVNRVTNLNTKHYVTFSQLFGEKHNLIAVAGFEYLEQTNEFLNSSAEGFPSDDYQNLSSATNPLPPIGGPSGYRFSSWFARVNYKFADKYMVQLSGRYDGSSRLGLNDRYGFFPSISLGWNLSSESFMQNISFISLLKLRAGWGLTGNADIPNFASYPLAVQRGYARSAGQVPSQLGNNKLRWERASQFNIGLDFGLFKDRVTGSIDFFHRRTYDLLLSVPIPPESGFGTTLDNVGEVINKGIEVSLTTQNLVGEFKWSTTFNFTAIKNEVTRLGPDGAPVRANLRGLENRAQIGYSLGYFFGPRQIGIDPQNGLPQYQTADGGISNDWNDADYVPLGQVYPNMYGGISNEFKYKNFDLSFLWNYSFGNYLFWATGTFSSNGFSYGLDNQTVDQLSRWRQPGDITGVAAVGNYPNAGDPSSRLLYKGDYMRLRNLTFGYTFPESVTRKLKMRSLRIYFSGQNLFLITPYPGDPEIGTQAGVTNSGLIQGNDYYTVPQTRTYQGGIQIGF